MRSSLSLVLLLVFTASLFAIWTENVQVYAVDKASRPINGVNIVILYQKNSWPITNDDSSFDGVAVFKTDKSGKVTYTFSDMVDTPTNQIFYYKVKANFSKENKEQKITCVNLEGKCHDTQPYPVTFTFDAYRVNIHVQDQNDLPLEGAAVYTASGNYTTDENGNVWVSVPNGATYSMIVEYGGKKRTITGKISSKDENVAVTLSRFNVRFRVLNDKGEVVPADILVNGETKHTDENGYVEFKNILSDSIGVYLRYSGGVREYNLSLTSNVDQELIVDDTPPVITISQKKADTKQKIITVGVVVTDPNPKASGLRSVEPVILKYNSGEGWKTISMYQTGKEKFEATVPLVFDTKILFEITAYDNQNKMSTISDSIQVKSEEGQQVANNITPENDSEKQGGELDIFTLAAGIVIVLIVLLIIYKKYIGEI